MEATAPRTFSEYSTWSLASSRIAALAAARASIAELISPLARFCSSVALRTSSRRAAVSAEPAEMSCKVFRTLSVSRAPSPRRLEISLTMSFIFAARSA